MFPVYPQDLSEITFILSPQPAIILDSSTWLKINSSWTRQKCRDDVGCCSFLCLQHLSPVTFKCWGSHTPHILPSTTTEFTGTFFPPFGLLNSFPLSSCSLSLLLSVPLRFSPEIVSKEAEVIASLPYLEFLMPLNAGSSVVRAWTLQLEILSGPSASLSSSLLGETGITIPTS